jgi:hypothetical protein
MKIRVKLDNDNDPNAVIELPIEGNETIGSIKSRIVEQNLSFYPYKNYESYCPVNGTEMSCIPLGYCYPNGFKDTGLKQCLEKESATLSGFNLEGLIIFQSMSIRAVHSIFICSAPGMSFELKEMEHYCNIKKLRELIINQFGSNCIISIKKGGSSEQLILKDEDQFPYREERIYISFEKEINIKEINGSKISNLRLDKQEQDIKRRKIFITTGAVAALLGIITTSYLFKNHLSESVMHSTAIEQSLAIKPLNFISFATLGTMVGGAIGWVASLVYEYLNATSSNRSNER